MKANAVPISAIAFQGMTVLNTEQISTSIKYSGQATEKRSAEAGRRPSTVEKRIPVG